MTATTTEADLIVLGLGPGGESVAQDAAEAGRTVVGVDPSLVGGECPYYGCIPSKMLLRAGETLAEADRANELAGRATTEPDYGRVAARIRDEATDDWDDTVAVERLEKAGVSVVRGAGQLAGRADDGRLTVEVDGRLFAAREVVVATGTAPAVPPIDGLAELGASVDGPVWTNREAVQAREAPASLIVLGGGAIGCEMAQGFARFGTAVTLIEAADRILGVEEPETSEVIAEVFTDQGITVATGAKADKVEADGEGGVRVHLDRGEDAESDPDGLTAERLLVAVGRRTNLADLGLDTVGLDPDVRSLAVDDDLRVLDGDDTPIDGLHAVGDVTGRGAFTHVANWQARILSGRLLGRDVPFGGYHGLAWATFTDPEVGRVGMSEAQAREAGLDVRIGRADIAKDIRGWIHGPGNDGFVKLVVDGARGKLVGATVVAPHGGEILGLLTLAVHARVPVETLSTMHYVFPTLHRTVLEALDTLS
jgi:pyruvate/2-oxoglutarate dehydrogenase complex dihydrolipoamide dehydrogenase (E3) component